MKPYPRIGSPYFYIKFTYNKVVRSICTYETDFDKAAKKAYGLMQKWIHDHETCADLTFEKLAAFDEKRYITENRTANHFDTTIGLHWRRLQEFFTDPSKITHDDIEDYIIFRKKQKRPNGEPAWAIKTIREHLRTLKRGLILARDAKGYDGLIVPKVWPKLALPKQVKGQRYASNNYSTDEIIRMISLLRGHAKDEATILICTGIRAHEAEAVKWQHFRPRHDMPGCAGMLYIPPGEDDEREVPIPLQLLPILKRALPLTIDHKRIYVSAMAKVSGNHKFGRRDFRAAFISAHAMGDVFGAHKVAGHQGKLGNVHLRYHNMDDGRKAALAVATWGIFFGSEAPTGLRLVSGVGSELGSEMGSEGYLRRRLAVEDSKLPI